MTRQHAARHRKSTPVGEAKTPAADEEHGTSVERTRSGREILKRAGKSDRTGIQARNAPYAPYWLYTDGPNTAFLAAAQIYSSLDRQTRWLRGITEQTYADLAAVTRLVEEWPAEEKRLVSAFTTLADAGWYWDLEAPSRQALTLSDALSEGGGDVVVDSIAAHFRGRLQAIEERVVARYPHRGSPLADAFEAHREGRYNLSVPVFLAQADGIWEERLSKPVFQAAGRRLLGDGKSGNLDYGIDVMFSHLFRESTPLWRSEGARKPDFKELNRHQVLHGEVSNYGTEINSLKAVSFLAFVCCVLDN